VSNLVPQVIWQESGLSPAKAARFSLARRAMMTKVCMRAESVTGQWHSAEGRGRLGLLVVSGDYGGARRRQCC
jgi:hypothetical protein